MKLFFVVSLFLICTQANADIYKYVDKDGKVTYTDRKKHSAYLKLEKTWKGWVVPDKLANYRKNFAANKRNASPIIQATARDYGIDTHIIYAVIHAESFFNPYAESHAGAAGLMQLMPATAKRYGVKDRFDPKQNIRGGTRYLKDLLKLFNNNMELALAAYNAGENAVMRNGNRIPPYKETQAYVKKVISLFDTYKQKPTMTIATN